MAIAVSSDRDGDHEIYLMAPDGSDVRQLTRNAGDDWISAWSPDPSWAPWTDIAFSSDGDLYATAEDGNEPASADRDVHDGIDPGLVTRRLVGGVGAQLLGAHSRPLSHQCRG
jgi:hypothetical protein